METYRDKKNYTITKLMVSKELQYAYGNVVIFCCHSKCPIHQFTYNKFEYCNVILVFLEICLVK